MEGRSDNADIPNIESNFDLRKQGLKGADLSDCSESNDSSSELSDSVFDMKSDYRRRSTIGKSFKKTRKGSTL